MLNKFFDAVFVINLDSRPDRWDLCLEQANKFNIQLQRIPAIQGKEVPGNYPGILKHVPEFSYLGALGCLCSHVKVLNLAKELNLKKFVVLEDDFLIVDDLIHKFETYYHKLPIDWNWLYFGGNHNNAAIRYNEYLVKPKHTFTTHAMAIKQSMYDIMLNKLKNIDAPIDVAFCDLQKQIDTCYSFYPALITQRAGYSDIVKRNVNYIDNIK